MKYLNRCLCAHPNIHLKKYEYWLLLEVPAEVYIKIRSVGTLKPRKRTLIRRNYTG